MSQQTSWILYVAHDNRDKTQYCRGSRACINVLRRLPDNTVTVQDVHKLMDSQVLPQWLDGTPVLVDTSTMTILKGSRAVSHVAELLALAVIAASDTSSLNADAQYPTVDDRDLNGHMDGAPNIFEMDVDAQAQAREASDKKVTAEDLQSLMEQRNRLLKTPQVVG